MGGQSQPRAEASLQSCMLLRSSDHFLPGGRTAASSSLVCTSLTSLTVITLVNTAQTLHISTKWSRPICVITSTAQDKKVYSIFGLQM